MFCSVSAVSRKIFLVDRTFKSKPLWSRTTRTQVMPIYLTVNPLYISVLPLYTSEIMKLYFKELYGPIKRFQAWCLHSVLFLFFSFLFIMPSNTKVTPILHPIIAGCTLHARRARGPCLTDFTAITHYSTIYFQVPPTKKLALLKKTMPGSFTGRIYKSSAGPLYRIKGESGPKEGNNVFKVAH